MGYVRSHLWGSLCLMGALLSFSWGDTTYNLAPGVDYFKWVQPTPNVINAVRYNRAYKEYDLELGFAKGQRDYSYKAPVSQIVPYYNYSGPYRDCGGQCGIFRDRLGYYRFSSQQWESDSNPE